jgi:hypothetical protein
MGDKYDTKSVEVYSGTPDPDNSPEPTLIPEISPEPTPVPEGSPAPTQIPMPTPDQPSIPDLALLSDSGFYNTDNLTNVTKNLKFNGFSGIGYTIEIFVDGIKKGETISTAAGTWNCTIAETEALSEGAHSIRARAYDNVSYSDLSQALTIIIDTIAPPSPSKPDLNTDDDTGISDSDDYTSKDTELTIFGTAQEGAIIELNSSISGKLGETQTSFGDWSITTNLPKGKHTITATAKDFAGNMSLPSTLSLTVDKTPPGVSGSIEVGDCTPHSVSLSWSPGTDNLSQDELYYAVYYSLSAIDSVTEAENGAIGMGYTEDKTFTVVMDLDANEDYFFNVIIQDKGGLKAAHLSQNATTLPSNTVEIDIQVAGESYYNGGRYDFIDVQTGSSSAPITFTIKNNGDMPLMLTGNPIVLLDDPLNYSISQPLSPTLNAGGSITFTVTFSPVSQGTKNASIEINNSDPDESPYEINLKGKGQ